MTDLKKTLMMMRTLHYRSQVHVDHLGFMKKTWQIKVLLLLHWVSQKGDPPSVKLK